MNGKIYGGFALLLFIFTVTASPIQANLPGIAHQVTAPGANAEISSAPSGQVKPVPVQIDYTVASDRSQIAYNEPCCGSCRQCPIRDYQQCQRCPYISEFRCDFYSCSWTRDYVCSTCM
jgi:hypothetical protein